MGTAFGSSFTTALRAEINPLHGREDGDLGIEAVQGLQDNDVPATALKRPQQ